LSRLHPNNHHLITKNNNTMVCLKELALASLLLTGSASALYSSKGPVIQVNEKNFKKEILDSNTAAVSLSLRWNGISLDNQTNDWAK
jgi:hypothetical protein